MARHFGKAIGLLLWAQVAMGSQAVRLELGKMTSAADAIVLGKVERVQSRWTGDRRMIVTEITVRVAERWKGGQATEVTLLQPGGVVDGIGQVISGMPRFEAGEEVVLFLESQGGGRFLVAGLAQGKYRVERSSDGRAVFAVPAPLDGLELVGEGPSLEPLPLERLRSKVRETLRRSAPEP